MKVQQVLDLGQGHLVELGQATWNWDCRSIRNRYPTATGGFSPRSSSEIPIEDLPDLIKFAATHDALSAEQCVEIVKHLTECIRRQQP